MTAPLWEALREGCGSCKFGARVSNKFGDASARVICRRYPPGILQDPFQPVDGWCGEWVREARMEDALPKDRAA